MEELVDGKERWETWLPDTTWLLHTSAHSRYGCKHKIKPSVTGRSP